MVTSDSISTGERLIPHRPGLDGLRGLSVAAVLAYHHGWAGAKGGFLGVSVFFTLSGFLITSLILAEHDRKGRVNLVHFWGRRFRRLLPAALVALAGIGVFGLTVASAEQAESLAGDIGAAVAYVANWRFIFGGTSYGDLFAEPSPVLHFWSLAIEEQFYLLYPLFMVGLLAATKGRRVPIAAVLTIALGASITTSFVLGTSDLDRIYFGTDTRAAELLAGALLALAVLMAPPSPRINGDGEPIPPPRGGQRFMVGWMPSLYGGAAIAALGLAVTTVDTNTLWLYRGGFAALSVVSCVAIAGATRDGPLANLLGLGPILWLGLRSYGLYLFHWPIFLWLDPETTGLDGLELFALRLAVTFAASEVSYRLIEMPIRYRRPLPRPVLWLAPASAAAVVALGLIATANAPAPLVALDQTVDQLPPPPVVPADMVILGDGIAPTLAAEFSETFGRRLGWRVDDRSDPDCPIVALDTPECQETIASWAEATDGARVVVVSFGAGPQPGTDPRPDATPDLAETLTALRDQLNEVHQVVWVTQPTVLAPDAPPALGIDPATTAWPRQVEVNAAMVAAAATVGDQAVDLADYLSLAVEFGGAGMAILDHDEESLVSAFGWAGDQIFALVGGSAAADPTTPRMLVVGDSVAYSVGRGLEDWGTDTGEALVWNVGTTGCGLARGGVVPDYEIQPSPVCWLWTQRFASHLDAFAPDVVVVVSTGWDLLERRLPEWDDFLGPGDPVFDEFLLNEYGDVVDSLTAQGAVVAWFRSPCASPERAAAGSVFSAERVAAQNQLITQLGESDPRVTVIELDALVCPDGAFSNTVADIANFRPDGVHFSDPGSRWVAERIGPQVLEMVERAGRSVSADR